MADAPFVLVDRARVEQFRLLGRARRLFADFTVWTDDAGAAWAVKVQGDCAFAATWLGPGWVFDPYAAARWADDLRAAREKMAGADPDQHRRELRRAARLPRLGPRAERLLWSIHQLTLAAHSSVIKAPDFLFGSALWGAAREAWPRQWRQDVRRILTGLTWLHVADGAGGDGAPRAFGRHTALLTHAADLRGDDADVCDDLCPAWGGRHHHHFLVNVGAGFLGALEQFAEDESGDGVRRYRFPVGGRGSHPTLRRLGKTGALVTVYLPAKLGDPVSCASLTADQRRLLQALVRETTRTRTKRVSRTSEVEIVGGSVVPDARGKATTVCPLLNPGDERVGFNGNGVRHGLGYHLATPGGWLTKAGYAPKEVEAFLSDLRALAAALGLTVVGLEKSSVECFDLQRLQAMAACPALHHVLERVFVRVYARADYVQRWNEFFNWPETAKQPTPAASALVLALAEQMAAKSVNRRVLAQGLAVDASFLGKLFHGKKPWPSGLRERAQAWVAAYGRGNPPGAPPEPTVAADAGNGDSLLPVALTYRARGWSVVPQLPGSKKPCVNWKPYQEQPPTDAALRGWFGKWPDAGLAVVLGPVSGLFVLDVDGPDAHAALLERLGQEPAAPKALSGSRQPHRHHLFFRCPDAPTKAKATPWHPQLEFRGKGGIVVVPPSLHKSGRRYEWAPGRSPDDLPIPDVPALILAALQPPPRPPSTARVVVSDAISASPSTRRFLSGACAEGPRWNDRLFRAACDLAGRETPLEAAESLLLAGARPWNAGEWEAALRTIHSAYSQPRVPGLC